MAKIHCDIPKSVMDINRFELVVFHQMIVWDVSGFAAMNKLSLLTGGTLQNYYF